MNLSALLKKLAIFNHIEDSPSEQKFKPVKTSTLRELVDNYLIAETLEDKERLLKLIKDRLEDFFDKVYQLYKAHGVVPIKWNFYQGKPSSAYSSYGYGYWTNLHIGINKIYHEHRSGYSYNNVIAEWFTIDEVDNFGSCELQVGLKKKQIELLQQEVEEIKSRCPATIKEKEQKIEKLKKALDTGK